MVMATKDEFKSYLGIKGSSDDEEIERLLNACEGMILRYIERPKLHPVSAFSHTVDGTDHDYVVCNYYPIVSLTSVLVDGVQMVAQASFGTEASKDSRIVYLANGRVFPRGRRNVTLVGTYGYAECPEDLKQAQLETVGLRYKERSRLDEASKQVGGETVTFVRAELSKSAKMILEDFRNRVPQ